MDNLYKNKYRTHTTRLENYDYSQGGYYFITICTDKKKLFFGKVDNGQMKLNKLGAIIKEELLKTSEIRKNVVIDKYVVMPNHLHVIIVIDNKFVERSQVIEPDSNLALQRKKFSSVERPRWGISGTKDIETPQRDFNKTPQRGVSTDTEDEVRHPPTLVSERGVSTDTEDEVRHPPALASERGVSTGGNKYHRKE